MSEEGERAIERVSDEVERARGCQRRWREREGVRGGGESESVSEEVERARPRGCQRMEGMKEGSTRISIIFNYAQLSIIFYKASQKRREKNGPIVH